MCENQPAGPNSVDYADSEQYEVRTWDCNRPGNLRAFIALVNQIRRTNTALQSNDRLQFHSTDNDQILAFTKADATQTCVILTAINLDPIHTHSGWLTLALDALGMENAESYIAHDLLTGIRYRWHGQRNYVSLDPGTLPAHLLKLEREC